MSDISLRQPDTKTIDTLFKDRELINVDPRYQRQFEWTRHIQKLLVDSVLRGLHIGVLMFRTRMDAQNRICYDVVDGKQRLLTLFAFKDDKFALPVDARPINGEAVAGKRYSDLPPALQITFSEYQMQIVRLMTDNDDLIRLQFTRLQSGKPLGVTQRRMTANGHVQSVIRRLVVHPVFDKHLKLKKKRSVDIAFATMLLYYEWVGKPAKASIETLDVFFDAHAEDAYTSRWYAIVKRMEAVFDLMDRVLSQIPHSQKMENAGLAMCMYLCIELYVNMQLNTMQLQNLRNGISRLMEKFENGGDRKFFDHDHSTTPSVLLERTAKVYAYVNIGRRDIDYSRPFVANLLGDPDAKSERSVS